MSRMIDLIRVSALPSNLMHSASKGALAVPPEEMMEILVHLATKNQIFGQQARFTLASWDEAASKSIAANPKTSKDVLQYMISPQNLRPSLLPVLLENPSVGDGFLVDLAASTSKEIVEAMRKSPRVNKSQKLLHALSQNPLYSATPQTSTTPEPEKVQPSHTRAKTPLSESEIVSVPAGVSAETTQEESSETNDEEINTYLNENAAEIAAEGDKPFQAIGGIYDALEVEATEPEVTTVPPEPMSDAAKAQPKTTMPAVKKPSADGEVRRDSVLQKIAKLDIKGRIQLAMKGNKEERSILIRDGTKIVALAVLESPKITDGEVEKFASQKNVLEAVLRGIPLKRRFAKLYPVTRNLVFNPRTPLDLSLGLMKHLLAADLKTLSGNKDVSDTVSKLALKMFKTKIDSAKKN
jgi:hypothetical protein